MKPPFHKAGAPALATTISVRSDSGFVLLIGAAALGGCAHKIQSAGHLL